jgi:hypothetical protein
LRLPSKIFLIYYSPPCSLACLDPDVSLHVGVEGPTDISPVEAARIGGDFHPFRVR